MGAGGRRPGLGALAQRPAAAPFFQRILCHSVSQKIRCDFFFKLWGSNFSQFFKNTF